MHVSRFHCQLGVDGFKTGVFQQLHYCTSWCQSSLRYFAVQLNSLAERKERPPLVRDPSGKGRERCVVQPGGGGGIPGRALSLQFGMAHQSSFGPENLPSKGEQIWDGRVETDRPSNALKRTAEIMKRLEKNPCQLCPQRSPRLPQKKATRQDDVQLCFRHSSPQLGKSTFVVKIGAKLSLVGVGRRLQGPQTSLFKDEPPSSAALLKTFGPCLPVSLSSEA